MGLLHFLEAGLRLSAMTLPSIVVRYPHHPSSLVTSFFVGYQHLTTLSYFGILWPFTNLEVPSGVSKNDKTLDDHARIAKCKF